MTIQSNPTPGGGADQQGPQTVSELWLKFRAKIGVKYWALAIGVLLTGLEIAARFDSKHAAIYHVSVVAIILIGTRHKRMREFAVHLLSTFPLIGGSIRLWEWEREHDQVVKKMNQMRAHYELINEPIVIRKVVPPLPSSPSAIVEACCQDFANQLNLKGSVCNALILELLYRATWKEDGDKLNQLWPRLTTENKNTDDKNKVANINKLAKILASGDDEQLSRFKGTVDKETVDKETVDKETVDKETVSVLDWILHRLSEFRLDRVYREMHNVEELWKNLKTYTDWLHESSKDSGVYEKSFSPTELTSFLDDLPSEQAAMERSLVEASKKWLRQWGEKRLPEPELDSMALVSLGIFAAPMPYDAFPRLSGLALRTVAADNAPDMVFGYLWERGKQGGRVDGNFFLKVLAKWRESVKDAAAKMGPAVSDDMRGMLRSALAHGIWCSDLPDHRTLIEIAKQMGFILKQVQLLEAEGKAGREKMEAMLTGTEELKKISAELKKAKDEEFFPQAAQKLGELSDRVSGTIANVKFRNQVILDAVGSVQNQVSELKGVLPKVEELSNQVDMKHQVILDAVDGVQSQLRDLKGMLPKVEKLFDEVRSTTTNLADVKMRIDVLCAKVEKVYVPIQSSDGHADHQAILAAVDSLQGQLRDLKDMLQSAAGHGSEYLITFGQTQGPLADLIDLLDGEGGEYDFKHYTHYARIGKLKAGQDFEVFYRKLKADLEAVLQAATCTTSAIPIWVDRRKLESVRAAIKASPWEKVEITVQQICRRHEFVPSKLQSLPCFKGTFELPPKIEEPMAA